MERNRLILLIIGIIIAVFVGGTMALILLYGEKQRNRLAEIGDIDEELRKEYVDERSNKAGRFAIKIVELALAAGFITIFAMALIVKANGNNVSINGQSVYVVRSSSMSKLNPNNPYYDLIVQNKWNNRFDIYDMVFVKDKPKEDGFTLGDIVVYKKGDQRIIHRIVKIENPSQTGDYKWHYTCCGDANNYSDGFVYYDEIVGSYTKYKIPFVGVFVLWLQSSLGYVVVGIIVAYGVYSTYLERNLRKVRNKRLLDVGYLIKYDNKLYLNPNPASYEPDAKNLESSLIKKDGKKETVKEPIIKLSRRDIVNTRKVDRYDFSKTSKSKYIATDFKYKVINCMNNKYVCVKVVFKCENKNITKYMFLPNVQGEDYIKHANKCMRCYFHSGKLNKYVKKQLKLFKNNQEAK